MELAFTWEEIQSFMFNWYLVGSLVFILLPQKVINRHFQWWKLLIVLGPVGMCFIYGILLPLFSFVRWVEKIVKKRRQAKQTNPEGGSK